MLTFDENSCPLLLLKMTCSLLEILEFPVFLLFEFKLQKQLFTVNSYLRRLAPVMDRGTSTKFPELACDLDVC